MLDLMFREAWQKADHADFFDARARYSLAELRHVYENFNEFRILREKKRELCGRDFVEIACATGELYRYLKRYHPEFRYHGFDISRPAIERARRKYPKGRFDVCEPNLSDVIAANPQPAVVWARDVVHHQPDPFEYLSRLLPISNEVTILRLRTRDKGATVSDPELSCQRHYNSWVPYIVLNIDEALETICKAVAIKQIIIVKSYVQLGGHHNRYLPKECYYPETGTSETALYIVRAQDGYTNPEIKISCRKDSEYASPLWFRGIGYLRRRLFR